MKPPLILPPSRRRPKVPVKEKAPGGGLRFRRPMRTRPWTQIIRAERICCVCGKRLLKSKLATQDVDALIDGRFIGAGFYYCVDHADIWRLSPCVRCGAPLYQQTLQHFRRGQLRALTEYKIREGHQVSWCPWCGVDLPAEPALQEKP